MGDTIMDALLIVLAEHRNTFNDWLNYPMLIPRELFLISEAFQTSDLEQQTPVAYIRILHNLTAEAFAWLKDFENYFPGSQVLEVVGGEYDFMMNAMAERNLVYRTVVMP